ncbi:MAG: magnesium transporter [Chloroflexota bacterium]|nr:magnesium transporter [Chloroflexota bacterium]
MAEAGSDESVSVRLFDADRTDRELTVEDARSIKVGNRQLLWIDVVGRSKEQQTQLDELLARFEVTSRTRRSLADPERTPSLVVHGDYLHLRVATFAAAGDLEAVDWLDILAAENRVMTVHDEPLEFLEGIDERIEADADLGRIDAAEFVAVLLDAAVTTYYTAVDRIEEIVDTMDARSLREDASVNLLPELVDVRRQIARLRQLLAGHREEFAALARPDLVVATEIGDFSVFPAVAERFERAISAVENSRDLLLGSFEVYMTRTAQRTNDTMKVLALLSALLLPGSLIAGLLGMNMPGPFAPDDPRAFWIVVALIGVLSVTTLVIARLRRWI